MNNISLAQSYLKKAQVRLKIIELLIQEKAYSDVIREAQEAVELSLKDAKKAQDDLKFVVEIAEEIISPVEE